MTAKEAAVVRLACSLEESSTASENNSKHATQNIAPAAKPSPICFFFNVFDWHRTTRWRQKYRARGDTERAKDTRIRGGGRGYHGEECSLDDRQTGQGGGRATNASYVHIKSLAFGRIKRKRRYTLV